MSLLPQYGYWGDYFVHTEDYITKNFFIDMAGKSAKYVLPLLRYMTYIMDGDWSHLKGTGPSMAEIEEMVFAQAQSGK